MGVLLVPGGLPWTHAACVRSYAACRPCCLALLAVAQAAPALAGSLTVRDATGDMWVVEEGSNQPHPAPHARIGDIERTTYHHTAHRVVVRTRFVELAPVGRRFTLWIGVLDEDRQETTVGVRATRRDRDGHTILMDDHGRDIACDVRHRVRYDRDVVRVVVPRSCLGDPGRLRFSTLSEQWGRRLFFANLDEGRPHGSRGCTGRHRSGTAE